MLFLLGLFVTKTVFIAKKILTSAMKELTMGVLDVILN